MGDRLNEAVSLLQDSGMLDRLKNEAQAEREVERDELLVKLALAEKEYAATAEAAAAARGQAIADIERLETELATAKVALNATNGPSDFSLVKMRGKLRRLSDPAIDEALNELVRLADKARSAFAGRVVVEKRVKGFSRREESNALSIAETLAAIRATRLEIEALKESRRPDNLEAVIDGILAPIRADVRRLFGM